MNQLSLFKRWLKPGIGRALIVAATYALSIALVPGADSTPAKEPVPPKVSEPSKETKKKAEKKRITGAELYAMHCSRCHAERFVTERTAAQWKTIALHMRVRANLPARQAKEVLKYLQEGSGNP